MTYGLNSSFKRQLNNKTKKIMTTPEKGWFSLRV